MKRRSLLALALLTAGCTSVPLSTMWRLRSFSADQLFALDPTQLRAAARVDARAKMKDVTISLEVEPSDGSARRTYLIPLEQPVNDLRLERPPADRRWFAFGLSKPGLVEYQRIKREYASVPKGSRGTVKIAASDDGTIPPELKHAFPLRVDVLLDPAEGYFTLINETKLDLSQQKK
ncbi:MAG TPA: hypothetical protein VFN64_13255 [Burkholderiaceae bacterium]|nr:hypothetical protein [Burkholderiaceae bacterium]